jgi:cytoskeleton-associated protein 5
LILQPNRPILSRSLRSVAANSKPSTSAVANNPSLPFINTNTESKKSRLARDANRWINEGGPTRKDLADLLQGQMEPCASKELIARLFSHDHNAVNDHISGLTTLADFYSGIESSDEVSEKLGLANLDFPLKYVSIKIHEPQPNLVSKCLDVVEAILAFLRQVNYQLADIEATCFVPTIIHKVLFFRSLLSFIEANGFLSWVMQENKSGYGSSRLFALCPLSTHTAAFSNYFWNMV